MLRRLLTFLLALGVGGATVSGSTVPRPAPEYAIKLPTGQQLLLSSYRGKVVALLFVLTDCAHCQQTCRYMETLQKEYGPRGLQTLAVAFNDMSMLLLPDFIRSAGATYPVGYDSRDAVFAFLQRSPRLQTYVPIMVFIDRKGVVRGQYMGDDPMFSRDREKNIRLTIEQLLKEPAPPVHRASQTKSGS